MVLIDMVLVDMALAEVEPELDASVVPLTDSEFEVVGVVGRTFVVTETAPVTVFVTVAVVVPCISIVVEIVVDLMRSNVTRFSEMLVIVTVPVTSSCNLVVSICVTFCCSIVVTVIKLAGVMASPASVLTTVSVVVYLAASSWSDASYRLVGACLCGVVLVEDEIIARDISTTMPIMTMNCHGLLCCFRRRLVFIWLGSILRHPANRIAMSKIEG